MWRRPRHILSPGRGALAAHLLTCDMVDFLKFDLKFMIWPSFNVADSCVVCAAMLLFVSSFIEKPVAVEKA